MTVKLSDEQIAVYLGKVPSWRCENDTLLKTFVLPSFRDAIRFVDRIADLAEEAGHHPDLTIKYKRVTVCLSTHDSHGVTGKDFSMAQQIESLPR